MAHTHTQAHNQKTFPRMRAFVRFGTLWPSLLFLDLCGCWWDIKLELPMPQMKPIPSKSKSPKSAVGNCVRMLASSCWHSNEVRACQHLACVVCGGGGGGGLGGKRRRKEMCKGLVHVSGERRKLITQPAIATAAVEAAAAVAAYLSYLSLRATLT